MSIMFTAQVHLTGKYGSPQSYGSQAGSIKIAKDSIAHANSLV